MTFGWGDVEQRHMTPRTDLASSGVNLPRQETLGIAMPGVGDLCKGGSGSHIALQGYEVDNDRNINYAVCGANNNVGSESVPSPIFFKAGDVDSVATKVCWWNRKASDGNRNAPVFHSMENHAFGSVATQSHKCLLLSPN